MTRIYDWLISSLIAFVTNAIQMNDYLKVEVDARIINWAGYPYLFHSKYI